MNDDIILVVTVVIISLISTGITYLLFKKLSSFADGQGKFWGNNVKYGGAVAGFVIVFSLLNYSLSSVRESFVPVETTVNIDGHWYLKLTTSNTDLLRYGQANVIQKKGKSSFQISGEIRSTVNPPSLTFFSHSATIEDQNKKVLFLYEISLKEHGMAIGNTVVDEPENFFIHYYDVNEYDHKLNLEGRLDFSREPFEEQVKEKEGGINDFWYLGKEIKTTSKE